MNKIKIKPLSVNAAWKGKRYKTKDYISYEKNLILKLPFLNVPDAPLKVILEFGFSNAASDIDNPVKPFLDILQKKYGFNDKNIYELNLRKTKTKKGSEYILFQIEKHFEQEWKSIGE